MKNTLKSGITLTKFLGCIKKSEMSKRKSDIGSAIYDISLFIDKVDVTDIDSFDSMILRRLDMVEKLIIETKKLRNE